MKRFTWFLLGFAFLTVAGLASASDEHKTAAKPVTVQGEVVDLGCYLAHGAKGADHQSCALKCVEGGMPMGLLTADNVLYLLTLNHDDAAPFNAAKKLAGASVQVTGTVHEKNGMKGIDVTAVKEMKAKS